MRATAVHEPTTVAPATLRTISSRVLWLASAIVHHANRVRPNETGVKVGGHQASSASMVSIMTALWFAFLEAPDRVSVKPHASPVLHAIHYLLDELDAGYLTRLREFGGLQSYPSRTKDPDPVDYSTGSVGIGATATIWGALAHRYTAGHFEIPVGGRQIALVGDAELDEGACWEALLDPMTSSLGEVLWIVDLNRQSLDRVVPEIAADRLRGMFEAAGWHCLTVKYGRLLTELFERPGGEELRRRIDEMPNEEYQRLLRSSVAELRDRLPGTGRGRADLERLCGELDDGELLRAVRDLGGHDLEALLDAYRATDAVTDRPCVVFAYTIKGWGLPTEGHPSNHSALLSEAQFETLAGELGADAGDPWARFDPDSEAGRLCAERHERLRRERPEPVAPPPVPAEMNRGHKGEESTQQAFGRFFTDLALEAEEVADRVVTVSPDVASSTNLGGWINRAGIWSIGDRIDWFADDTDTLVRWRETEHGRHIELGIAETNLVGLLGELGRHLALRGRAAVSDRHDLRPVRRPRAGAVVVRDLRRRAVDPGRDPVGDHARTRGRGTPVGHHAGDRRRAAALHLVGARLRTGLRVDLPARDRAARPPRRALRLLPALDAAARPGAGGGPRPTPRPAPSAGGRRSRAATGCGRRDSDGIRTSCSSAWER